MFVLIITFCYIFRISHLFGICEEAFLRLTEQVMDALVSKMDRIISWPQKNEYQSISEEFESFGRYFLCFIYKKFLNANLWINNNPYA